MNDAIRRAVRVAEGVERAALAIRQLQVRRHLKLFAALRASGMREVTCACGTMMLTRGTSNQCPPCRGLAPHLTIAQHFAGGATALRLDSFERVLDPPEYPAFERQLPHATIASCPFCGHPIAIAAAEKTLAHGLPHCTRFAEALQACHSFEEADAMLRARTVHA